MNRINYMLGDWARIRVSEKRGFVTRQVMAPDLANWHDHQIEPIPLTAEILEKNGFKKGEDNELRTIFHLQIPTGFERDSYTIQISIYKKPICDVSTLFKCWGYIPPSNGGCQ